MKKFMLVLLAVASILIPTAAHATNSPYDLGKPELDQAYQKTWTGDSKIVCRSTRMHDVTYGNSLCMRVNFGTQRGVLGRWYPQTDTFVQEGSWADLASNAYLIGDNTIQGTCTIDGVSHDVVGTAAMTTGFGPVHRGYIYRPSGSFVQSREINYSPLTGACSPISSWGIPFFMGPI